MHFTTGLLTCFSIHCDVLKWITKYLKSIWEKNLLKNGHVYMHHLFTLLYGRNWHNIVNQRCLLLLFSHCCVLFFCHPMSCSPPGSSVHRILRQEYWSGLLFHPAGDLPDPGSNQSLLCLQVDSLPSEPLGKPPNQLYSNKNLKKKKILGYLALKAVENRISIPGVCSYPDAHEQDNQTFKVLFTPLIWCSSW